MSESTLRTCKQPNDTAIDAALWRLSLVLREISENIEPCTYKKEPPCPALGELAAKLGIAATQLCEIETGRREVSPEVLERILGVIKSNIEAEEQP